jgi:hypothetical protein
VFTSPWAATVLRHGDMVYIYGHPKSIADAIEEISKTFVKNKKGNFGLACSMEGGSGGTSRTRNRSVPRTGPVRRAPYIAPSDNGSSFSSKNQERSFIAPGGKSFENVSSVESSEEKSFEHDANSYQPRQRVASKAETIGEENLVEDFVNPKTMKDNEPVIKKATSQDFDPQNKGFQAFHAVMKGYLDRKEVKEKYNWERKIKEKEHGVQQFLDKKHEQGKTTKEHEMAVVIQKNIRGYKARSNSGLSSIGGFSQESLL